MDRLPNAADLTSAEFASLVRCGVPRLYPARTIPKAHETRLVELGHDSIHDGWADHHAHRSAWWRALLIPAFVRSALLSRRAHRDARALYGELRMTERCVTEQRWCMAVVHRDRKNEVMKIILTAALAASLLSGTAAMASSQARSAGVKGRTATRATAANRVIARTAVRPRIKMPMHRQAKASGAPAALSAPQQPAPERAADSRQQGPRDRSPVPMQSNQPAPAAPQRAAVAQPQGLGDRNQAAARFNQPAPERAADSRQQGPRDRSPVPMKSNQPAPAAPQRAAVCATARPWRSHNQAAARFNQPAPERAADSAPAGPRGS